MQVTLSAQHGLCSLCRLLFQLALLGALSAAPPADPAPLLDWPPAVALRVCTTSFMSMGLFTVLSCALERCLATLLAHRGYEHRSGAFAVLLVLIVVFYCLKFSLGAERAQVRTEGLKLQCRVRLVSEAFPETMSIGFTRALYCYLAGTPVSGFAEKWETALEACKMTFATLWKRL